MASARGWPLLELRHEVPTLERVFLNRTRGLAAVDGTRDANGPASNPRLESPS